MCNSIAHLACANHTDCIDRHASVLGKPEGENRVSLKGCNRIFGHFQVAIYNQF